MAGTPQSFAATSTLTVPVTFASFEARGAFADRGTGVVEEVLDVLTPAGGQVIDDNGVTITW